MKISEIFNLDKSQAELDFVDVDITTDTPLYLDPFFLSSREDNWSINATKTVRSFFQRVIDLIGNNQIDDARELFQYLHEPNETCLGVSTDHPKGRGVGSEDTDKIFNRILSSQAVQTGLLLDLEDSILFVDHFHKDKLSDLTTNLIRMHLIEYTQSQCRLHGIDLTQNIPSGFFWDGRRKQWMNTPKEMLVIDERKIILVPKGVVSFCKDYTPNKYLNHFVLNFLQNEYIKMGSTLVQHRKNGTPFVTKKDLREDYKSRYSSTKEFLRDFTQNNPQVLQKFKDEIKTRSLTNLEISEIDINEIADNLIDHLNNTASGNEEAENYHKLVMGILELIFYPFLIYPQKEQEIHQGRKRIDISFENSADQGIFYRLSERMNIPCQYIFVECKNYSSDPRNPTLDQMAGRFSFRRGEVGFILCRSFQNRDLFIQRCRDTYADGRGLIIPLVDEDIIELLENINEWNFTDFDRFCSDRVREITMG